MLSWQWPWMLLVLPLPWLVRKFLPARDTQPPAIRVPFYNVLIQNTDTASKQTGIRMQVLILLVLWLMLVLSAARPVWFGDPVNIAASGRDLMLAIDLSDSMRVDDMRVDDRYVTRFDAIRQVAGDFIKRRRGDRIGLILFGQRSYLQTPLTFDRNSVVVQLDEALPGFAGSSTAIGDAIGMAITTLRDRPAGSRVLVLMTDGSNTAGSEPVDATKIAIESGIRIHTIGVGSSSKRIRDVTGAQKDIDPSRDLDEATLMSIARQTGGQYFRAHDPVEMDSIYAVIDELEPAPEDKLLRPQRSLYHWPLSVALLCAACLLLPGSNRLA